MLLFLITLAFSLTVFIYKKNGVFSPTFIHCFYSFGCILTISIINVLGITKDQVSFSAMPLPDFDSVIIQTVSIYVFLIIVAVVVNPFSYRSSIDNKEAFTNILNKLEKNITKKNSINGIIIVSITFIFCNFVHFISIDHSVLLSNHNYLSIKEPNMIGLNNSIGRIYHFLFRYLGLVFIGLSCLLFLVSQKKVALLTLLVALYPFVFLLVGNSRWAAFYIAIAILVFSLKNKKIVATLLFIFLILVMQKVLVGRNLFSHGILHTFDYLYIKNDNTLTYTLLSMCINVFEGAMNLANTLLHNPSFHSTYINLSFSPMFSFMDGFSSIRDVMKYKWAPNVPMSSISESYQFGLIYFLFFIGMYYFLLRNIEYLFKNNMTMSILVVFFVFIYISVGMHTYSIRTFWKLMVFMSIYILFLKFKRR